MLLLLSVPSVPQVVVVVEVHAVLQTTRDATAWGLTAAPQTAAGNAGSTALLQAPSQAHQ